MCFYFVCLCSFATLLSIEDNAFDKHGGRLRLLVVAFIASECSFNAFLDEEFNAFVIGFLFLFCLYFCLPLPSLKENV